jgi:hypothetical protein
LFIHKAPSKTLEIMAWVYFNKLIMFITHTHTHTRTLKGVP